MEAALLIVQLAVGANMIAFGLDQVVRPRRWTLYIPSWIEPFLPVSKEIFMKAHAVGNMVLGGFFALSIFPEVVPWIVFLWYISILVGAYSEDWTIGVRDSVITLCVFAYILLI